MEPTRKNTRADELSQTDLLVPEWQIKLGEEALQGIENGTADLMGWEETKSKSSYNSRQVFRIS